LCEVGHGGINKNNIISPWKLGNMNCDKIVAIGDNIVTVSSVFSRSDNSTCISLHFYKIDAAETTLTVSGSPVTCNIAQRRAVVYCFAEVVENKTGLYRYFLLCGPDRLHGTAAETPPLRLYTVDNRAITLFGEFRLPAGVQTYPSDIKFEILDGPTVCFVVLSDIYVATSDGAVRIYPTGADGVFRHLTSWVQDDYLLVTGLSTGQTKTTKDLSASQSLTLCIDMSKQLFGCSSDTLVPNVYQGMVT